ncbi:hypothetical protein TIFTF001_010988 [Ficus carica]|uniref:Glycine-rich protein n=1 Tax=Ficus carica TaxID=3494 RepID=A0AA88D2G9_FICCA|nr:hypothetical protein TIFTF001_010988 [Ficus carica]
MIPSWIFCISDSSPSSIEIPWIDRSLLQILVARNTFARLKLSSFFSCTADFQGHEISEHQSSTVEEVQKDDEPETENPAETVPVEHEQIRPETEIEYNQRDGESKEQQYVPRRPYQNQRGGGRGGSGGGRRGYINGRGSRGSSRGGGPYQNGRNQYYDQPGGYYQRGYYNNRGRGGRGGGSSYNNHGSVVQGGQMSATSVGVGS